MNVLQPNKKTSIITLLTNGVSQREIGRKVRVDRKTIRKYARMADKNKETQTTADISKSPGVATGSGESLDQNPHPGHRLLRRHLRGMNPCRLTPGQPAKNIVPHGKFVLPSMY